MMLFASVFNLDIIANSLPRFFLVGAVFLCASSWPAQAYQCAPSQQAIKPDWISQFGQNADGTEIYGYAQSVPQKRQSLADINQLLKSNALADLAMNIRSNVSSKISTELNFDGDQSSDKTSIQSAAESSLSISALSGTSTFIDQQSCVFFARVSLLRIDVPYVLALSTFREFEAALKATSMSAEKLARLPRILTELNDASNGASLPTQQQFKAITADINRVIAEARDREIALLEPMLDTLSGSPKQKRDFLNRFIGLINAKGNATSASDLAAKSQAETILSSIASIIGSKRKAIAFSPQEPMITAALADYVTTKSEKYWLAEAVDSKTRLAEEAANYELSSGLFVDISTVSSRRFGIDELEIKIILHHISATESKPKKQETLTGKAIGRPLNDSIISKKLISILETAL